MSQGSYNTKILLTHRFDTNDDGVEELSNDGRIQGADENDVILSKALQQGEVRLAQLRISLRE